MAVDVDLCEGTKINIESWTYHSLITLKASKHTFTAKRRFWRDNSLSLTLAALFFATWIGQALTGWHTENDELVTHGRSPNTLFQYLHSGHFVEVTMENWESEFLQLFTFVALTSFLFQRGSAESKDPDHPDEDEPPLTVDSPAWARAGGWRRKIFAQSLSLTFFVLFVTTFLLHAAGGVKQYNEEQLMHGETPVNLGSYMLSSRFWFALAELAE